MELYELLDHTPETGTLDASKFEELSSLGFSLVRLRPEGKEADREKQWEVMCGNFRALADSGRKTNENMGIAVGPASGVVVVDIDNIETFTQWCIDNGVGGPLTTRIHKSPKGWHIFYQRWPEVEGQTRVIRKDMGCDLMFDRTQVVAPGSVVRKEDGNVYAYVVVDDREPADAPGWLRGLVGECQHSAGPQVRPQVSGPVSGGDDEEELGERGTLASSKYLEKMLTLVREHGVPQGERNETLFKVCSGAKGVGANRNQLVGFAKKYAFLVGIPELEAIKTAESAAGKSANRVKKDAVSRLENAPKHQLNVSPVEVINNHVSQMDWSKALAEYYHGSLLYCYTNKKWMQCDGKVWREAPNPDVLTPIYDYFKFYMNISEEVAEGLQKHYLTLTTNRMRIDMEGLLKMDPSLMVKEDQFDQTVMKLAFKNAVVEFRDRHAEVNVRPITWEDYITKTLPLDWPFEFRSYTNDDLTELWDEDSLKFDEMLGRIFKTTPEVKPWVVRFMGYSMAGTSVKEKILPIMVGKGNNGKSVLFNLLMKCLSPMAKTVDKVLVVGEKVREERPSAVLTDLVGLRFGFISETEENDYINDSTVKALTGGDPRTARPLYGKTTIQIPATYTIFLATNHLPRIASGDEALWRRIYTVPFNTLFTDKPTRDFHEPIDRTVLEWIDKPHIGVVTYLLAAWLRYTELGLPATPDSMELMKGEYRQDENSYTEFINDCLYEDEEGAIGFRALARAYRNWANDNQIKINDRSKDQTIVVGIVNGTVDWGTKLVPRSQRQGLNSKAVEGLSFKPLMENLADPRPFRRQYEKSF